MIAVMVVYSGGIVGEGLKGGFWKTIWHDKCNEGDFNTLTTCIITALLVIQL